MRASGPTAARLFNGLKSDRYDDAGLDGRMATLHAGDVVLTLVEANRHRVTRSTSLARRSGVDYLKIVAPWVNCAGVEQKGREAWVAPDQWSIYDTTDSYAVANPVRVEHLIDDAAQAPPRRARAGARSADSAPPRRQRRRGAPGARTMRSAYRSCPACRRRRRAASAMRSRSSSTWPCSTWPVAAPR
ncbi:MAG: hypothetical protein IPG91_09120 [Ideonella sp.]|nr:hypothetical protein [Ideonella sp.]